MGPHMDANHRKSTPMDLSLARRVRPNRTDTLAR